MNTIMQSGHSLLEASTELDGTTDISQLLEASDLRVSSVVDESQTTTNVGKFSESQVGEIGVVDEGDVTRRSLGHVGERHSGEVVGVETSRAVDNLQRRSREGGNVGNRQVGGPDELVQGNRKLLTVGLERQVLGQVLEVKVNSRQTVVVVDVHGADRLQVNAVQALQESVGDGDTVCLVHTSSKGESVESGQRSPVNSANIGQRRHAQGGQERQVVEGEGASDLVHAGAREGNQATDTVNSQVTIDGLNALQVDGVTCGRGHNNVAGDAGAFCNGCIGSTSDCVGGGRALRRGYRKSVTCVYTSSRVKRELRTRGHRGSHKGRKGQLGEHFDRTDRWLANCQFSECCLQWCEVCKREKKSPIGNRVEQLSLRLPR